MQKTMTAKAGGADFRIIIIGLVLGAITAGLVVAYLASLNSGSTADASATTQVVVASENIAAGTRIDESLVELKAFPPAAVLNGAVTGVDQAIGQVARYPIASGQQVSPSSLVAPTKGNAISFLIPQGLRGFTVPVDVNNSPAALLAPGDFVDVVVLGQVSSTPQQGVSSGNVSRATTLLQNVQVLAVQNDFVDTGVPYDPSMRGTPPKSDQSIGHVMLAVTPEQAQLLWMADQDSKLTLSLRGFGDDESLDLAYAEEPAQ